MQLTFVCAFCFESIADYWIPARLTRSGTEKVELPCIAPIGRSSSPAQVQNPRQWRGE